MVSGTFTSTVQVESVDKRKACPKTSKAEGTANPIRADVGLFSTFQLLSSACAELLWWLGVPGQWLLNFLYLVMFVIVMLPAFIPVFLHYLLSSTVVKNITYGPSIRHQLDIYLPKNCSPNKSKAERGLPVVIFFSGGAWIIGYKTWAFMMGKVMQANGIIFVAPDYRNFPQAVAKEMVDDVMLSVQWVFDNIQNEGGDISRISLVGQSAGAHLTSLAIIEAAQREAQTNKDDRECWKCSQLERWVGISGPYDIVGMGPILHKRGLHPLLFQALMGVQDLAEVSPIQRVEKLDRSTAALLPPATLFHGTGDATVPAEQSTRMAEQLTRAGARVTLTRLYPGKSHTDPILEDPAAGVDPLMTDLLAILKASDRGSARHTPALLPALMPAPLLRLARWLNPF